MSKVKKTIAVLSAATLAGLSARVSEAQDVVLEISSTQPEFFAQDRAIWDLYEDENPGVKIELFPINEDTEAAYQARVAAGDPGDLRALVFPTKDNYQTYVNLLDLDFPWWDLMTYDAKSIFEKTNGIEGYAPAINVRAGLHFQFVYHADVMADCGLDPKTTVRSMDELRSFLADFKGCVDQRDDMDIVLDTAWQPRVYGRWFPEIFAIAAGGSKDDTRALYAGDIAWTDIENNPLVPYFELLKEFTEAGYFPDGWWEQAWEQDMEARFIAKKSALTLHGPWIWNKVLAQNPDADLDGFLVPPNGDGVVWQDATTADRGSVLYVANSDDASFEEAKKALYWWTSPEIVKLRAEAIGFLPAMNLSSVGGVQLQTPQFMKVIQPAMDGAFGDITFDDSLDGQAAAGGMKKSGTPFVIEDNANAPLIGSYVSGEITIEALMEALQTRWENAYGAS